VIWVTIPLTALAGLFLVRLLSGGWGELDVPAVGIHGALVVILMFYAALNLAAYGQATRSLGGSAAANLGLAAVSFVLIALVSLLFGVGWSAGGAARGLVVGLTATLLLAGLSAASRLVAWGEHTERAGELWYAGPPAPVSGLRMLVSTLEDVSEQTVGAPHDLQVVVAGQPQGELAWALRDFHAASYTDALAATISSPVVIAPADQATPELGSAYVGQSFAIRGSLDSSTWGPLDWLGWLTFYRAPSQTESVVLWVRSDVHFRTDQALNQ
jgi:hypothetical protein